jgi:hypothetical protein
METNAKTVFLESLKQIKNKSCGFLMDNEDYKRIIDETKSAKLKVKKSGADYNRIRRFDILTVGDNEKLVVPLNESNDILYYLTIEEMYDIIDSVHKSIGHGGMNKMYKELSKKYKNITQEVVKLFVDSCKTCQLKKPKKKKHITVQPILSQDLNSRGQVDLIDMQSQPDEDFKFILVYQDHLTKFCFLKALKTKRMEEVAYNLLDIFTIIGAPNILHSDNGREFCNQVITELSTLWSDIKLVHGRPRHSQSQGSVERANRDIEEMLSGWLTDNKTTKWSQGLRFVQFMKNRSFHSGIRRSPYEAVFGQPVRLGLKTTKIPGNIINTINTEEDLTEVIKSIKINELAKFDDNINTNTLITSPVISNEDSPQQIESIELNRLRIEKESKNSSTSTLSCVVCQKETTGAHLCNICKQSVHSICGTPSGEDGFGSEVICFLCSKSQTAISSRMSSLESLKVQANKMLNTSEKFLQTIEVGRNVTVPIPQFDKGRIDFRNIMAVVLENKDNNYKVGTKNGVIKKLFPRSELTLVEKCFFGPEDVPIDKEISLRQESTFSSLGHGQGVVKCSCKKNCESKRCVCKSNGILCNSRCHNSLSCFNK